MTCDNGFRSCLRRVPRKNSQMAPRGYEEGYVSRDCDDSQRWKAPSVGVRSTTTMSATATTSTVARGEAVVCDVGSLLRRRNGKSDLVAEAHVDGSSYEA